MRPLGLALLVLASCAPPYVLVEPPLPAPRRLVQDLPAPPAPPPYPCPTRPARLVFGTTPPTTQDVMGIARRPTIASSQDSRLVAAPMMDGRIVVFDAAEGAIRGELVAHRGEVRAVAFIDSNTLVSVGLDHHLRLWNLAEEKAIAQVDVGVGLTTVAVSPRDSTLLVGAEDGKLRLFDRTGRAGAVIEGHPGGVAKVAWRDDGTSFVSSGADQVVRLYDADGNNRRLMHTLGGAVMSLVYQPKTDKVAIDWGLNDTIRILAPNRSFVQLWKWSEDVGWLKRANAQVSPASLSLTFNPDGDKLAFATCGTHTSGHEFAASFGVVDVATDKVSFIEAPNNDGYGIQCAMALVWTPDGSRIVRLTDRQTVAFYDPVAKKAGPVLWSPSVERPEVRLAIETQISAKLGVTLTPAIRDDACEKTRKRLAADARTFVCDPTTNRAFEGHLVEPTKVLDTRTGQRVGSISARPHTGAFWASTKLALAPDGKLLAGWSDDGTLVVTETTAPFTKRLERRGLGGVTRLSWTTDGRNVALFSQSILNLVRVVDATGLRVEVDLAMDDTGAFEDLGVDPKHQKAREKVYVRLGDLPTGPLLPLARAAAAAKPGVVRRFLAGEPAHASTLASCRAKP